MTNATTPEDWSRHHDVRAGSDFVDAIWLDGYEQQSVWGYDEGTGAFFAQIWRNGSRTDNPDLWLTPPIALSHPQCIIPWIVDHTGHDPLPIVRALGIAHPNPQLRNELDIILQGTKSLHPTENEMAAGQWAATQWLQGVTDRSPLSESRNDDLAATAPSPALADAESSFATGAVYRSDSLFAAGVETTLVYATNPG